MGKIAWDRRFQVGIFDVDQRNRNFIEKINELIDILRNENDFLRIRILLSDFSEHAHQHFQLEERYLCSRLDALEYSDHCERHLFFENFLRTPLLSNNGENQPDSEELADFLTDWVAFHVQYLDKDAFGSPES